LWWRALLNLSECMLPRGFNVVPREVPINVLLISLGLFLFLNFVANLTFL
jgi:hypothetical protein